jgi:hypothetical protein
MSSLFYMPLEKYELHSLTPTQLTSASESHIPMIRNEAYAGKNSNIAIDSTSDSKHEAEYSWRGMAQRHKPRRPSRSSSALGLLKALLLPMLAIAYLTFCYVVHYRIVPVNTHGIIDVSPQNIGE